jgi:arsenical pump membrane protein
VATVASVLVLAAVLGVVAWGRVPDALAAVPAAVLVVVLGLVTFDAAVDVLDRLLPTLVFLASIFVIAETVRAAGLFDRAGEFLSWSADTSVRRLLVAISLAAVAVTTVMSLDATAVLFTPVVIALVRSRRVDSERPLIVTTQLANAGSGLLPVSNLTNLLVFSATGLTFGGFALRMALPTAAASAVVIAVVCRRPRGALAMDPQGMPPDQARLDDFARFVIASLVVLFIAFFVLSQLGGEPAWAAAVGAAVLAVATIVTGRERPRVALAAASPSFVAFVAALGVVVQAAVQHGLGSVARELMPDGAGFWALLAIVALAALLANVVNNIPATLVLLPVMTAGPTGRLLALLVGVNVGPNLTYTGSLATLLWRRVVRAQDIEPSRCAFFRLAALATPLALFLSTVALWFTLRLTG